MLIWFNKICYFQKIKRKKTVQDRKPFLLKKTNPMISIQHKCAPKEVISLSVSWELKHNPQSQIVSPEQNRTETEYHLIYI